MAEGDIFQGIPLSEGGSATTGGLAGTLGKIGGFMIGGPPGGSLGGALGDVLGGGGEEDKDVKVDVVARLDGGEMKTSFGGEGTNWIIIVGIVAAIYFLSK